MSSKSDAGRVEFDNRREERSRFFFLKSSYLPFPRPIRATGTYVKRHKNKYCKTPRQRAIKTRSDNIHNNYYITTVGRTGLTVARPYRVCVRTAFHPGGDEDTRGPRRCPLVGACRRSAAETDRASSSSSALFAAEKPHTAAVPDAYCSFIFR